MALEDVGGSMCETRLPGRHRKVCADLTSAIAPEGRSIRACGFQVSLCGDLLVGPFEVGSITPHTRREDGYRVWYRAVDPTEINKIGDDAE